MSNSSLLLLLLLLRLMSLSTLTATSTLRTGGCGTKPGGGVAQELARPLLRP
jgi:hypothetical protein